MFDHVASVKGSARTFALLVAAAAAGGVGCSSSGESAQQDKLTANVGKYAAAPAVAYKPKVGVPPFSVKADPSLLGGGGGGGGGEAAMETLAADQMTTLLDQTDRFRVIERAQLQHLLDEQNLEGIVKAGEMAKTGQVRGVDYLLLGRVTNLRCKAQHTDTGFGVGQITGQFFNAGGADIRNKETKLTTEAGVDIRLVNPTTGEVLVSNFSEYAHTDSAKAQGVTILGATADANADVSLSDDDKGKILRLALDDSLRKMLPKIDAFLTGPQNKPTAGATAAPAAMGDVPAGAAPANAVPMTAAPVVSPAAPAGAPANAVAAKKFCPTCGKEMAPGTKFCPTDGTKID